MALSQTMLTALNRQFNEELNSAYIYDSMAADFYVKKLPGFASWMTHQAEEEREHARRIHRYLDDRGERVFYDAMAKPQAEWENPMDTMKAALEHEIYISKCIHELIRLARKEDDIPTEVFLNWFVDEQVEEESAAQAIIDKLELIGEHNHALLHLDKDMALRQSDEG